MFSTFMKHDEFFHQKLGSIQMGTNRAPLILYSYEHTLRASQWKIRTRNISKNTSMSNERHENNLFYDSSILKSEKIFFLCTEYHFWTIWIVALGEND